MSFLLRFLGMSLLFSVAVFSQDSVSSDAVGRAVELRNNQQFGAAIALLQNHVAGHPGDAHAQFLLGETLYWTGDWSGAKRHFIRALNLDPGHVEARRQLEEIRQVTAPWFFLTAAHRRDDQPLQRSAAMVEAGAFLTPLQRLIFQAEPQRYGAAENQNIFSANADWLAYWPGARLDTELGAGYILRQDTGASDWTGRASLGARLPKGVALRARSERAPYLWTAASLETPIMSEIFEGVAEWNWNGWMAQAAYGIERFPDSNHVRSAHAWLLAPLARSRTAIFQAGYALAFRDSDHTRWVPAASEGAAGRYIPYYTPDDEQVHRVVVSGAVPLADSLIFRANGGFGFWATELAPPPMAGQLPAVRNFHPWNGRASLEWALTRSFSMTVSGEHQKTAFWKMHQFSAGVTYRFSPRSISNPYHD